MLKTSHQKFEIITTGSPVEIPITNKQIPKHWELLQRKRKMLVIDAWIWKKIRWQDRALGI
jgi:hypothetical protein